VAGIEAWLKTFNVCSGSERSETVRSADVALSKLYEYKAQAIYLSEYLQCRS
jgi:hypothetical protein